MPPRPAGPRLGTVVALTAALGSYLGVRTRATDALDHRARALLARPAGPAVDRAIAAGTDLGSIYGLLGAAGTLAVSGRRRSALRVAGSGLVAWTVAQAAKPLLRRPRPYLDALSERIVAEPAGTSWPSGHAAVAAAMAVAIGEDLPVRQQAAVGAAVAAVGASRLYVGVHHLTDVVAGLGLGVLSVRTWDAAAAAACGALRRRGPADGGAARAGQRADAAP